MRYENPKMELLQLELAEIICTSPGSVSDGGIGSGDDFSKTDASGDWGGSN